MILTRLLQITMLTLAAFGTLLLGMSVEDTLLPLAMVTVAVVSFLLNDMLGVIRLGRVVANIAAIAAAAIAARGFDPYDPATQLMSIANMLVYLQFVILFQEKTVRVYWQLTMLSLLQVVVAGAINQRVEFGLLLVLYLFVMLLSLSLQFIYRETLEHTGQAKKLQETSAPAQPIQFVASVGQEPISELLGWRLTRRMVAMTAWTLAFTVIFFITAPRSPGGDWKNRSRRETSVTGVPAEVSLGEMRQILQSDELAMRTTFTNLASGAPYLLAEQPYFRGVVLEKYAPMVGTWRQSVRNRRSEYLPPLGQNPAETVLQKYQLEPGQSVLKLGTARILFGVAPTFRTTMNTNQNLLSRPREHTLFGRKRSNQAFDYNTLTTGFRNGRQLHLPADRNARDRMAVNKLPPTEDAGPGRLGGLTQQTSEIVLQAGIDANDHFAVAKSLEEHFLVSGGYFYSLNPNPNIRNESLDPIEDFVTNHKTGHCEYFAGALVLMLRSQNVPARMVIGYHGGEYDPNNNLYQVRQLHAHAWVEALVPVASVPVNMRPYDANAIPVEFVWMRLDPTPFDNSYVNVGSDFSFSEFISEAMDYAQVMWDDYVLDMDSEWNWIIGLSAFIVVLLVFRFVDPITRLLASRRSLRTRSGKRIPRRTIAFYRRLELLLERCWMQRPDNQTPREFAGLARAYLTESGCRDVSGVPRQVVDAYYQVRFGGHALDTHEALAVEQALVQLADALDRQDVESTDG